MRFIRQSLAVISPLAVAPDAHAQAQHFDFETLLGPALNPLTIYTGVDDIDDNWPVTADQVDLYANGLGDACDADDGVLDGDRDGRGDACDDEHCDPNVSLTGGQGFDGCSQAPGQGGPDGMRLVLLGLIGVAQRRRFSSDPRLLTSMKPTNQLNTAASLPGVTSRALVQCVSNKGLPS